MQAIIKAPSTARRSLLKAAAAGVLTAPFMRAAHAKEALYINSWGGIWEEAATKHLFAPFTAETGIEIKTVSPVSIAKLASQVKTGTYEFDITTLGDADIVRANGGALLEPVSPKLGAAAMWPGAVFQNGVGSHAFATVLAYNESRFKGGGPESWAEFWDLAKFPGQRSLQRHAGRVLAIALLADGVAPEALYPMDLDRAFKSLDRIKSEVRVWWTQGPQSSQLLRDGEVDAIGIWHSQPIVLRQQGQAVKTVWKQALVDRAYWVVAKGTPRAEQAWKFIQFAIDPKRVAGFCAQGLSGPLNPKAYDFLSPEQRLSMPTSPEHIKEVVFQDAIKMAEQLPDAARQFERWISR